MSKRPLSGGKLPKRSKARKLTPTEALKAQLEEARKDASNLKTAIGEIAVMCLDEVAEIKGSFTELNDPDEVCEHLTKLLEGLKKCSEVTIA